jgi:hypothetical protein
MLISDTSNFWPAASGTVAAQPAIDLLARPHLRLPLESAIAFANKTLDLVWGPVSGASAYEVDIEGRDQPIVTPDLSTSVNASEIPLGRHVWRVRARLSNASVSPWSDPRVLSLISSPDAPRKPASAASGP